VPGFEVELLKKHVDAMRRCSEERFGSRLHIGLSPTHSCRLLMVMAQEPTQPLATLYAPGAMPHGKPRKQQDVASALMISLGMVVLNIFAQCSPQGALAEQNELGQTLVLC
jgi:hypothetical protein